MRIICSNAWKAQSLEHRKCLLKVSCYHNTYTGNMGSAKANSLSKTQHQLREISIYLGVSHVKETSGSRTTLLRRSFYNGYTLQCVGVIYFFSNSNHQNCLTFQQEKAMLLDMRLFLEMSWNVWVWHLREPLFILSFLSYCIFVWQEKEISYNNLKISGILCIERDSSQK